MSNRASYQRPNPNLRCGGANHSNQIRSVAVCVHERNGYHVIANLPFNTATIRQIATDNPSLNPVSLAVALASQPSVAGVYMGKRCSFRASY